MNVQKLEPCVFTIFGGTGDLSRRKLLPALAHIVRRGAFHEESAIVGVGREAMSSAEYREFVESALTEFCDGDPKVLSPFVHYHAAPKDDEWTTFIERLNGLILAEKKNHIFYLALPPSIFAPTIRNLGTALRALEEGGEMATDVSCFKSGFNRVVVEKPFGTDLESAKKLNATLHEHFGESCIYRIDHYLGKDTVQNLLTYRFANAFFESSWNRDRIESIQITVGESLGVGSRAGYYDRAGALRDMVQNHLMQLLTLVAMEPPSSLSAGPVRREKIKVLEALEPVSPENIVRGRYTSGVIDGEPVVGYLDEDGVPPESTMETFVALRLFIDNWRWKGVPFYLRTGKRMPEKSSQIIVRFKPAPVRLFEKLGVERGTADMMVITLQPEEGFTLHFDIKAPGAAFDLRRVPMTFSYADLGTKLPDAYETLLSDVLEGDQTLFVHGDETELSWKICTPLVDQTSEPFGYAAGTYGPEEAAGFAIEETHIWQNRAAFDQD